MGIKHAVVTTVVRDDLEDGGAGHIAETIRAIHELNPDTTVEILVSDCNGEERGIHAILDAQPEVFCHNVETARRLFPKIRDCRFDYDSTLAALRMARDYAPRGIIKSAIMVGHGETPEEVEATLEDIVATGCDAICIGQYLRPSNRQTEVQEFVTLERFQMYEEQACALGFKHVVSGPFVRSSYRSEEILETEFARERLALA
jgi:lipoic acid synthetase